MKSIPKLIFSVFFITVFSACDQNRIFEENTEIEKGMWDAEKPLVFQTVITDTINPVNVYLNIRNAGAYPFSNIFLFLNTRFPQGQIDRDTVEIMLATPEGKWLGNGLGDIWDNQVLFKSNVRFPQKGEYRFELTQAMRMNPLPGIMDAGLRIEKATIVKN